ncbi:hypothetical protein LBMAG47_16080 [Planctomycetia bacterium]|nr:hypothetical protein LBMAG47_16080 [Planctomycetia bacterium]
MGRRAGAGQRPAPRHAPAPKSANSPLPPHGAKPCPTFVLFRPCDRRDGPFTWQPIMRLPDNPAPVTRSAPPLKAVSIPDEQPAAPDGAALDAHLARAQYGRFLLTDAIRPGWRLDVVPRAGYRHDAFVDPAGGSRLPALVAAVSGETLFETFMALLDPLGDTCDVVLESTHDEAAGRREFTRSGIERLVLESILWDFEDLLLNDGCSGIAVMHPEQSLEVQFDEHKLLVVYAPIRAPFERILRGQGLDRDDRLRVISQGEHMHTSNGRHERRFGELAGRLGCC